MNIFIVFLVAALLFLMIRAIRLGLKRLLNRYSGLEYLSNLKLVIELIIWLIYIVWATEYLFREKFFYQYLVYTMIFITTGFVAWFLLKDIFAGIIFRIRHNLKNDSYICAGELMGQIKSQHLTCLKLLTDNGHLLSIPYSRIIQEVITELAQASTSGDHVFHLKVDSSISKTNAESLIRNTLLNNPWSNLKEEPRLRFMEEDENGYIYEISFHPMNIKKMNFIRIAFENIPSLHII
jgi:hypothetical protein